MKSWTALRVTVLIGIIAASWAVLGTTPPAAAQDEPLVFCSDLAFPPMEYLEGSTPVGADIDIAEAIGEQMGRDVEITNVGFDGIIAALQSDICDAIISTMHNTPTRAEEVNFVNYLDVGQALIVQQGNPLGVETLDDLCGLDAGAQVGTTNLDSLNDFSDACVEAGNEPLNISAYPSDTEGILAMQADQLDVYQTDAPVAAYYIGQNPEAFEYAGPPIDPAPVGIALRKDDTDLLEQMQAAVDELYADGTMVEILAEWDLEDFALSDAGDATPVATPEAG